MDIYIALFAIRTYDRLNFISHGGAFDLYMKEDFAGLAKYLEHVAKTFEDVLSDEEKPLAGKWRELLTHIRKSDEGVLVAQIPLKILERTPSPPGRPLRAVLRTEIKMGK